MLCSCRTCAAKYEENKSRAEIKGYCSALCQHEMARKHGYKKPTKKWMAVPSEYTVLKKAEQIGNIPVERPIITINCGDWAMEADFKVLKSISFIIGTYLYEENIKWLFETHLKDNEFLGSRNGTGVMTDKTVTCAIIIGNEGSPQEIYITEDRPVLLTSLFKRVV